MRKPGLVAAIVALAMFGPMHPAAAFSDNDSVNDGDDTTPDGVDILVLTAVSDGDGGGPEIGEITVTMALQAASSVDGAKYKVYFDYTGDLVTDQTPGSGGCEFGSTADATMKTKNANKGGGAPKASAFEQAQKTRRQAGWRVPFRPRSDACVTFLRHVGYISRRS